MQRAFAIPQRHVRRLKWNQDKVDVIVALLLTGVSLLGATEVAGNLNAVSATLIALQTLPIAFRRHSPMRTLYVTGGAITLYSILGYVETAGHFGVLIAFFTVAANESRWRAFVAAALTTIGIFASFIAFSGFATTPDFGGDLLTTYLAFGLAWFIGDNLRVRRAYAREMEEKEAQRDAEREDRTSMAIVEERARIARELHDVVAHYVSVMVVQAAGARRVAEKDPVAARGALEAIESAGRTALAEMRRMLEVLRADDPGMGPQPGLGELDRLIGQVREVGLPVDLRIVGKTCCLPAGMDLAAYRIVQEALTNTVKHGGKANAIVTVRYRLDAIEIEVLDDGRGAAAPLLASGLPGGHGLIGMKERVGLFGGQLSAGPVLTGGYRVYARMPIEPEDSARARSEQAASRAANNESTAASTTASGGHAGTHNAAGPDDHRHEPQRPKHQPSGVQGLIKSRTTPPMMVRVLPPHPTEQSGSGSCRTREGDL
jgi:signal transduction histidine kinase